MKVIGVKLDVDSKDAQKSTEQLTGSFDKMTGGAVSGLRGMASGIKTAVRGMVTLKGAIAATGIGALIIAVSALKAAFTSSEEGQNKFAKIMAVINVIIGNSVDLLADLGEKLIWAFENPKEAWDSFIDTLEKGYKFVDVAIFKPFLAIASNFVLNFQSGILKARIAWNEFTGDSDEAEELKTQLDEINQKVSENNKDIEDGGKAIIKFYEDAAEATKDFIAEQEREAKLAAEVADMRAKADKIERDLIVKRSELESQIAALRLKSRQEDEFTAEQRRQALLDAQVLEDQLLTKETEYLELRRDAQVLENTFSRSNKQNLTKEAEAIAAVNRQTATRLNNARQVQRELNRLNGELEREQELLAKTKVDDAAKKIQDDVQVETQRTLAVNKVRLKAAEESNKIEEERLKTQAQYDEQAKNQRVQIATSTLSTLFELGKKEQKGTEAEQKKAFKRNKLLGIAQASIQTFQSAQGAYLSQLSIPTPDAPFRAVAAAAAATAAGIANIVKIKRQQFKSVSTDATNAFSGGGGGGNGSAGVGFNPSTPTISALPNFNQTAAGQQGQGSNVRAYVVQDDIENQAALNKRINQKTTL